MSDVQERARAGGQRRTSTTRLCGIGRISQPNAKPAPNAMMLKCTNRAGGQLKPACSSNDCDLGTQLILLDQHLGEPVRCRLLRLDDGLLACSLLVLGFLRALRGAGQTRLILSTSEDLKYFETKNQAAMATAQTTTI